MGRTTFLVCCGQNIGSAQHIALQLRAFLVLFPPRARDKPYVLNPRDPKPRHLDPKALNLQPQMLTPRNPKPRTLDPNTLNADSAAALLSFEPLIRRDCACIDEVEGIYCDCFAFIGLAPSPGMDCVH